MAEGKVLETNNHSLFVMSPFNRHIKESIYYRALKSSLMRHGWLVSEPMRVRLIREGVNRGKYLMEGAHNRFVIAMELGISVRYIVVSDNATMEELICATIPENVNTWLERWLGRGKKSYALLKEYATKTGISVSTSINLLAGGSATSPNYLWKFKNGQFELGDTAHANLVAELVLLARHLGAACAGHNGFHRAISKAVWAEGLDIKYLKNRMMANVAMMKVQRSMKEYLEMLEAVYNKGSRNRYSLLFLANEAARKRAFGSEKKKKPETKKPEATRAKPTESITTGATLPHERATV
jgi:hypothetical protein